MSHLRRQGHYDFLYLPIATQRDSSNWATEPIAGVVGVDLRGCQVCVVKCPGKEIRVQQDLHHLKFEIDESSLIDSQIWKWQVHHIPPMIFLFGSVKIDGAFACDMRSGIRPEMAFERSVRHEIWTFFNDHQYPLLTSCPWNSPGMMMFLIRGNYPKIAQHFRFVKYINLPRRNVDLWSPPAKRRASCTDCARNRSLNHVQSMDIATGWWFQHGLTV